MRKTKDKRFARYSVPAKIALGVFFLFFLFEAVINFYPVLFVVNNSLKTSEEIYKDSMALTMTWTFSNYVDMFNLFQVKGGIYFEEMLFNSVWQTVLFLAANMTASVMVSYVLARYRFPGHGLIFGVLIFVQTIPIIGSDSAGYKLYSALNLINNPFTIWLSWLNGFTYSAFILYGTFKGISKGYSESAKIDGASNITIFTRIIFPLAFPAVIALLVTNFVGTWNNYSISMISLNKYPNLAYGLYIFQLDALYMEQGDTVFYTALVITALPGLLLYAGMQKIMVKNLTVGGIKG